MFLDQSKKLKSFFIELFILIRNKIKLLYYIHKYVDLSVSLQCVCRRFLHKLCFCCGYHLHIIFSVAQRISCLDSVSVKVVYFLFSLFRTWQDCIVEVVVEGRSQFSLIIQLIKGCYYFKVIQNIKTRNNVIRITHYIFGPFLSPTATLYPPSICHLVLPIHLCTQQQISTLSLHFVLPCSKVYLTNNSHAVPLTVSLIK